MQSGVCHRQICLTDSIGGCILFSLAFPDFSPNHGRQDTKFKSKKYSSLGNFDFALDAFERTLITFDMLVLLEKGQA